MEARLATSLVHLPEGQGNARANNMFNPDRRVSILIHAANLRRARQRLTAPNHNNVLAFRFFEGGNGLDDHLRANARWIAHGDSDFRAIHGIN